MQHILGIGSLILVKRRLSVGVVGNIHIEGYIRTGKESPSVWLIKSIAFLKSRIAKKHTFNNF